MTQDSPDPLEGGEHRRPPAAATGTEPKARGASGAGIAAPETQSAGSPWNTDSVTSWVSPNLKKNKKEN